MKIAVATDDKKTIRRGHFGEGKFYAIYEILNGEIFSKELRENPHVCKGKHAHGQAIKIIELLPDCQIYMGRSMGAKSLPQIAKLSKEPIVTTIENVEEEVNSYLDSKDEYFKYYNAETGKFCECVER